MKLFLTLIVLAELAAGADPQRGKVTVAGRDAEYVFVRRDVAAPLAVVLSTSRDPALNVIGSKNWNLLVPQTVIAGDWGVKVLEAMVGEAGKDQKVLIDHQYLIAAGDLSWMAFYAASRSPALFAGTLAFGGNPKIAIDSNRLFGGNTVETPVYWVQPQGNKDALNVMRSRLTASGFRYEVLDTLEAGLAKMGERVQESYPTTVDCESGSPAFGRCFWLEIVGLDAAKRNDAFPSTRVTPGSGASLGIGPFGYDPGAPGPGVVVGWLPDDYKGPLQREDRIIGVDGKTVDNGVTYMNLMDEYRDEKSVVVMVQRGKERKRLETRIIMPKREEAFTGRVQGQFLADSKEILLGSRGVGQLRLQVPPQWAGASVNWNGDTAVTSAKEGCWNLGPAGGRPCPSLVR
jgi:hypothetical protein